VGGARLEKAADCAYASSVVCDVVLGDGFCEKEEVFWEEEEVFCEREEEK
jgi:hypothetical protein